MAKSDRNELFKSTAKSIFGAVPFGGSLLDELFYEYSGRIKQNRLNHFIEILADNFTKESEIKIENIKTEDFNDLFESIIRRAVRTKSQWKLNKFKDILINELNSPTEQIVLVELYLDLISDLSEEELTILYHHKHFDLFYEEKINKMNQLKDRLNTVQQKIKEQTIIIGESKFDTERRNLEKEIEVYQHWLKDLEKYKSADFYNLDDNKFMLFKQRLFSNGLLLDNRMNRIGSGTFQNMGITEFGQEFIDFIRNKD